MQLRIWGLRQLSLGGKIPIVKNLCIVSSDLYCQHSPDTREIFREVERIVSGFISNRPDRIKRQVMVKPWPWGIEGGGGVEDDLFKVTYSSLI